MRLPRPASAIVQRRCAPLLICLTAALTQVSPLSVLVHRAAAQESPPDTSTVELLEDGFEVRKIATGCAFTEGPAVDRDNNLYFSDGPNDRIMRRTPDGNVTVFAAPCGAANGLFVDAENRLLLCQSSRPGGGRALARIDLDKRPKVEVLAAKYQGRRFIAPNDLCVDRKGRIYFTDPYYDGDKSQPSSGVYRLDPDGRVKLLIANLLKPNGIVMTADNRLVYVSDRGTQKLHKYRVTESGALQALGVHYDFSPDRGIDGMALDEQGNIWGAAGQGKTTGLFVISPQGKLLLHRPMPEFSTNVTFGGSDRRDVYFTATTSVYLLRSTIPGQKSPAGE